MSDNVLFASINLPIGDWLKQKMTTDIMAIDVDRWWWDNYRGTHMLPLMTRGGIAGKHGASNKRNEPFHWVQYTPISVRAWFDNVVFPWMGMRTRISALLMAAGTSNKEHIDCDLIKMGTRQHKFRCVIHGKTNTLYFKTQGGDVYVPDIATPFIMDGSWPHGMYNATGDNKLTLAVGSPWEGNSSYNNIDIMMDKQDHIMPNNYKQYFQQ